MKPDFPVFCDFCIFGFFDVQIQILPDTPNIIPGCPIFLFLLFVCQGVPYASLGNLSLQFIIFFQIFFLSAFISMPKVFEHILFLFALLSDSLPFPPLSSTPPHKPFPPLLSSPRPRHPVCAHSCVGPVIENTTFSLCYAEASAYSR